jgi:hypothetical protein
LPAESEIAVFKRYTNDKFKYYKHNAIIEVDTETFKILSAVKYLNINYDVCKVFPEIDLIKCYNCCGYNHKSTNCRNSEACQRCSGEHGFKDCPKKDDGSYVHPERCINCTKMSEKRGIDLESNHSAWDSKCEVHKNRLEKLKDNIYSFK